MIQLIFDDGDSIKQIENELGELRMQAKPVLKRALNSTAKKARKMLAKKAQETYAVKNRGFNKSTKIKNATNADLASYINVTGSVTELKSFKVNPASYRPGLAAPTILKGKVLKGNGYKRLERGNLKAFITKFASGHVTVAQRKSNDRLPIKVLYSPSAPKMIGSVKNVYGVLEPNISDVLRDEIKIQINKTLAKGGLK